MTYKEFERKMAKQRARKGYCDLDVWNIDTFIEDRLYNILKEFKKKHMTYPMDITSEEWNDILSRMIFLLEEMNEDTCSIKASLDDKESYIRQSEYIYKCKDEFYDLLKKWHYDLWS